MPQLEDVTVEAVVDDHPDLAHIGEFTDSTGPDARTVDRRETGDWRPGEPQYFVAALGPDDTGNPDSVDEDHQRLEAYNRGEWCMIGVRAVATVRVRGAEQTIKTGGLWGVESDAGDGYVDEIARAELTHLQPILTSMGVDAPDDLADRWDGTLD